MIAGQEPAVAGPLAQLRRDVALATGAPDPQALESTVARCLERLATRPAPAPEPLRTLHHFACTGGTLLAKCIAALPNVQLLSEVDPLSDYVSPGLGDFTPSDMTQLLRRSTRGTSARQLGELFAAQMRVLHADAVRRGLRLVVRDHAHSQFCHGNAVAPRPTLRELMPEGVPLRSLVTVRHPLDSFASLRRAGWVHFRPGTLEAYCRRQIDFLDRHAGVPVLRYEDFVAVPEASMAQACEALELRLDPGFVTRFARHSISGDSGRSGATIAPRPSTPEARALEPEAARSGSFRELAARLGYGARAGELQR